MQQLTKKLANHPSNKKISSQAGFTLIELMIALVLGLLISAAAIQIYLTNARTSTIQKSGSELQDASVFGLQQLENHLRLANLGNSINKIDNTTVKGGIVLTGFNLGSHKTVNNTDTDTYPNTGYLTRSKGDTDKVGTNGWTGYSNMTTGTSSTAEASDQITIQFLNTTGSTMSDCEGNTIPTYDAATTKAVTDADYPNRLVIERFYLRMVTGKTYDATKVNDFVLACDAGRIDLDANKLPILTNDITVPHNFGAGDSRNFGDVGQEFIRNVDQFKILFGVQVSIGTKNGEVRYVTSHDYLAMPDPKPSIVAIKLGIIVHGATPVAVANADEATTIKVLGVDNKLKTDATRLKQVRTAYESTTLLRNARVITITNK